MSNKKHLKVVESIHQQIIPNDKVQWLRDIADNIEKGEIIAVAVVGIERNLDAIRFYHGNDYIGMVGAIEKLKHKILMDSE